MRRTGPAFQPFASRGRKAVAAILATFALFSAVSVTLSVWATSRSQYKASVLEVAARQRTLAERYVREVLLVRAGAQADPAYVGALLDRSARALLEGGTAPAVNGDDDETFLSAAKGKRIRAQLVQERKLVRDLRATGAAFLAGRPVARRSPERARAAARARSRFAAAHPLGADLERLAERGALDRRGRRPQRRQPDHAPDDPRSRGLPGLAAARMGTDRAQRGGRPRTSAASSSRRPTSCSCSAPAAAATRASRSCRCSAGRTRSCSGKRSPRSCIRTTLRSCTPPTRTASRRRSSSV